MSGINSGNTLNFMSSNFKFLLIITGFWPSENSKKSRIEKAKSYFFVICASLGAAIECFFMILNYTDVITFIQYSAEGLAFLMTCLRFIFFMINRNRIIELARKTEEIFLIKKTRDEDLIVKLWHERKLKLVDLMIRSYGFLIVALFVFGPILFHSFPLSSKLPLICYQSPWNYIIYFIESILCITSATGAVLIDSYIVFFVGNFCAELKCIAKKITKINKNDDSIKEIVDRHVNAINYGNEICRLISLIFCVQYTTTIVSFCTSAFTVFLVLNVLTTAKSMTITIVLIWQIFLFCVIGETISQAGLEISNAINNSNWHYLSIKNCKNLQFILLISQKSFKLDLGIIPPINLKGFSVFISSAYSYITIINRLLKR